MIRLQQKDLFTRRWRRVVERPDKEANDLQIPLVTMLRWCIKDEVVWRHVPNGEHRDPRTGAKLKAMGVLPGSADLEFFWKHYWEDLDGSHTCLRALFMELKLQKRLDLSVPQQQFAERVEAIGAEYFVVRSMDAAVMLLGERGLVKGGMTVCGRRW